MPSFEPTEEWRNSTFYTIYDSNTYPTSQFNQLFSFTGNNYTAQGSWKGTDEVVLGTLKCASTFSGTDEAVQFLSLTIYGLPSSVNTVSATYYNGTGYSNILRNMTVKVGLKTVGSSKTATIWFEGTPPDSGKGNYIFNFGSYSYGFEVVVGSNTGTYVYVDYKANTNTEYTTYQTRRVSGRLGSFSGVSGTFCPAFFTYVTDNLYDETQSPKRAMQRMIDWASNNQYRWYSLTKVNNSTNPNDWIQMSDGSIGTVDLDYQTPVYTTVGYYKYSNDTTYSVITIGTMHAGTSFTAPSLSDAGTRPNWTFNSWAYVGETGIAPGQTVESYPMNNSMGSNWDRRTYTVILMRKVASTDTPTQYASYAIKYEYSATLPSLTDANYTFNGWKLNDTGTAITGSFSPDASNTINGVATLYSSFTPNQYTFVYNGNGGTTPSPSSVTVNYGVKVTFSASTRTHCNFNGWYDASSGGNYYGTNGSVYTPSGSTRTINLYAQFTGKIYAIQYTINKTGTSPATVSNTQIQYPHRNSIQSSTTLPTLTLANYVFNGWDYNGSTYTGTFPSDWSTFAEPAGNTIAFTSNFEGNTYTVTYMDATGSTPESTQTITYGTSVTTVPSAPSRPAYTFQGWYDTNGNKILEPNATTYNPTATITLRRRYIYTRTLSYSNTGWSRTYSNIQYPNTITLPIWNSTTHQYNDSNVPVRSGYRISSWNTKSDGSGTSYTSTYTPDLNSSATVLYPIWSNVEIASITIADDFYIKKDEILPITATVEPNDWIGTLKWASTDDGTHYSIQSSGERTANITGRSSTGMNTFHINAYYDYDNDGTLDETEIKSNDCTVVVSSFIPVNFYTVDEELYGTYLINDLTMEWVSFPDDSDVPSRTGYEFIGWLRKDDNTLVTVDTVPTYPIDCVASWMTTYESYVNNDKDTLILQLFNKNGDGIIQSIDMGLISSMEESFYTTTDSVPTPTMSSENTFITDLNCTERIIVTLKRKNPINPDDSDDNPIVWSNGKWIKNVRGLVDRWQSETDGIKFLYIPRDMRLVQSNGEEICVGANYDMLGYVKPREYEENEETKQNIGLLYDGETAGTYDRVLVGYNAVITAYSDTYTAEYTGIVTVNMTFTLGGMLSQYQNWMGGMLLQ